VSEPRTSGQGLAVASFVLGVCALIWAMIAIGGLFGAVGLVLGILHLRRSQANRPLATWGITLSIVGIVGSLLATAFYVWVFSYGGATMRSRVAGARDDVRWEDWAGVAAPPLTVRTIDGESVSLESLKGRKVVLNFWATWCGPCRQEAPELDRLAREADVTVLAVSQEREDVVRAWAREKGYGYTFAIGSRRAMPEPFRRVRTIPTNVFIDRNGIIQEVLVGGLEFDELFERATAQDRTDPPRPAPALASPPADDEDED
jgi:thiol-disulfide isomerase/thioredoxin